MMIIPPRLAAALWGLAVLCAPPAANAHDFWIQPGQFQAPEGATIPMTLQVGHGPERQRSSLPARRVVRFGVAAPDGAFLDQRGSLNLGGAEADGALQLSGGGTHVVVLETDSAARSRLSADRFAAYAREEGLEPALQARRAAGSEQLDASERYGRRAKALVQVGAEPGGEHVTRPLGLSLEIVPEVNPYAAKGAAALPVRVFYEGKPLAGALVKLTDLSHDDRPLETHRTDAAGRARFAMPGAGAWLLNVVWTKPLADQEVDFETVFSSLSFGFPPDLVRGGEDSRRNASGERP